MSGTFHLTSNGRLIMVNCMRLLDCIVCALGKNCFTVSAEILPCDISYRAEAFYHRTVILRGSAKRLIKNETLLVYLEDWKFIHYVIHPVSER